jgi:hypothetical protein
VDVYEGLTKQSEEGFEHGWRGLRLLRFDSGAGLLAGTMVLLFAQWLSVWFQLPAALLYATGAVNILYGLYSGRLAWRASRGRAPSRTALRILVCGNAAWLPVCLALAAITWPYASWLGSAHLVGEGLFVGTLAAVEAKAFLRSA